MSRTDRSNAQSLQIQTGLCRSGKFLVFWAFSLISYAILHFCTRHGQHLTLDITRISSHVMNQSTVGQWVLNFSRPVHGWSCAILPGTPIVKVELFPVDGL